MSRETSPEGRLMSDAASVASLVTLLELRVAVAAETLDMTSRRRKDTRWPNFRQWPDFYLPRVSTSF